MLNLKQDNASGYVKWRESNGTPIFFGAGIYWENYKNALLPATNKPLFIAPDLEVVRSLLKQSKAMFIRYVSDPSEEPTEWWYIVCEAYDKFKSSSNTRSKINRGHKSCTVNKLGCEWLALNGYQCYLRAASRYSDYIPVEEQEFRNFILSMRNAPVEHWGVFSENELAGYGQCIIEDNDVNMAILKFDPKYLTKYSAYAFFDSILKHYVSDCGYRINNGTRSISHDTNIQDFLMKFGFKRYYGRLNIAYQPQLGALVRVLYPFRKLIYRFPPRGRISKLSALLFQEELRRKCHGERIEK